MGAELRWRSILLGLLLLGAVIAGGAGTLRKQTSELPVYVTGAERMWHGEPIYRRDEPKPFTYPPFFALPFLPFLPLSGDAQRLVWYAVNLALLAHVLLLVDRFWRARIPPAGRCWFWVVTLLLAGRHLLSALENQSHDLVVLWLVTRAGLEFARGRDLVAATWAGIGAACKATPLLFLLLFVVQRRWRAGLWLIAVAAAATALPDLVLPQVGGERWAFSWSRTLLAGIQPGETAAVAGAWMAASNLNQSLSGTLHRLVTPVTETGPFLRDVALLELGAGARRVLILVGQSAVLAMVALAALPRSTRGAGAADGERRRFAAAAAVACGMVLLSPMSSKAHFGVLLLPIAVAVADWRQPSRDRWVSIGLCLLALLGPLTVKGLAGKDFGELLLSAGSVTACALVALAVDLRILVRR